MKKVVSTFIILLLIPTHSQLKSQVVKTGTNSIVTEINDILKNNPYTDNFQELTFFYSIEVTSQNELVVNLEYDGPFRTVYKARISDLNPVNQNNSSMMPSTYLCWKCKSQESTSCVQNEIVYTSGDKELHTAGEICVMFSNERKVYKNLSEAFNRLFSE